MLFVLLEPFLLKPLPFLGGDRNSLAGLDEVAAWPAPGAAEPPGDTKLLLDFGQQLFYLTHLLLPQRPVKPVVLMG
ncbi:hypothetical protein ES703_122266 [subsurface metagenome]